ncbi:MAG: acyltransferase [Gammaproteobacteria bacterium]|nr:acyltransferase [Gammaproteobacteria bacterium]
MLTWLPKPMVGVIAILLYSINFVLWFTYLFLVALCKWIIPNQKWRRAWQPALNIVSPSWVVGNTIVMRLTTRIQWDIEGLETLNPKTWYLLLANHQAWTDILVLFKVLVTKISPIRYFLKEELRWVPLLGQACWILDFPFMRRHSSTAIARHPELRLQDIATTRKTCEKFKHTPITLINFAEGTRFRPTKYQKQKSPYQHLLKPKAGGIAFTLSAMDGQIKEILDVTLVYSPHRANFWDFCCGKITKVTVKIRTLPITEAWAGDYLEDKVFRQQFQERINQLWQEKDETINKLL